MTKFLLGLFILTGLADLLLFLHGPSIELFHISVPVLGLRMWAPGIAALLTWGWPSQSWQWPGTRRILQVGAIPAGIAAVTLLVAMAVEGTILNVGNLSLSMLILWLGRGMLFALGEELGWRAGLQQQLTQRIPDAHNRYLMVAVVWGLWHIPVLVWAGLPAYQWMLFAISLWGAAAVMGIIWDHYQSIWPITVWHMGHNVWINNVSQTLTSPSSELWIGEVGIICALMYLSLYSIHVVASLKKGYGAQ